MTPYWILYMHAKVHYRSRYIFKMLSTLGVSLAIIVNPYWLDVELEFIGRKKEKKKKKA